MSRERNERRAELNRDEQAFAQPLNGIDYSREKEITEDEMTDELFAAYKRGDADAVMGMTQTTAKGRSTMRTSAGAATLATMAEEARLHQNSKTHRLRHSKLAKFAGDGLLAQLLAQTNGNEELARLLLAGLKANSLMAMDGNCSDEIARDMGAYGLAESIRQVQYIEAQKENDYYASVMAETKPSKFLVEAIAEAAAEIEPAEIKMATLDLTKPEPEAVQEPGFVGKYAKIFTDATGISKMFGMAAKAFAGAPKPTLAESAANTFSRSMVRGPSAHFAV